MEQRKQSGGRALFESSLELKCLFIFGLALAIVISISFWLYYEVTKKQIDSQNPLMGKLLCEREFLTIHMKAFLKKSDSGESAYTPMPGTAGSASVPVSVSTSVSSSVSPVSTSVQEQNNELDDFVDSLAYLSENLNRERFQDNLEKKCRLLRPTERQIAENDDKPNDKFESGLLEKLMPIPVPVSDENPSPLPSTKKYFDRTDEQGRYQYYLPLRMESSCKTCHQMFDSSLETGTLLGILQVTITEPPAQKEITRLWAMLLGAAIVTAFLALIAFYGVIRWVVIRPLRNLREVSEAISRGDITKRAELSTGDEFELLGVAFNRMLRHLVATQEKLREANIELEKKVDEQAQLNLQLFATNKVKSDFMATMSHELRTPLNSILGFSDVLGSISSLTDKQKKYVANINKSGQALLNMINDILDMAKIEAGRLEIQLSVFSIQDIVLAQCDMARPLADKKNIDMQPSIPENLPLMHQDGSRIQQIVNNLLSNAIKFTPEGGRIQIQIQRITALPPSHQAFTDSFRGAITTQAVPVSKQKGIPYLELRVIDTGVGISETDQQIIFEKFRQAKASMPEGSPMTREYSGSGLGLSIVKELCRMLEGSIHVQSTLGFGSTFTVYLPWELSQPSRTESPMMSEIQEFTKAGLPRKGTAPMERP